MRATVKTALSMAALAGATLAGCAKAPPPVADPNFVPATRFLAEIAATPFECAEHDAEADTCASLSRIEPQRRGYVVNSSFLVDEGLAMQAILPVRIQAEQFCGDSDDLRVEVPGQSDGLEDLIERITRGLAGAGGRFCTGYYRDGAGGYVSVSTDAAGARLAGGTTPVRFFAGPKPLRDAP